MSDESLDALTTLWEERGLSPSQLRAEDDGTLLASDRRGLAESQTLFSDPSTKGEGLALSPEPLELGELLGKGGMGHVRLADQPTLRRQVAVKTAVDTRGGAVGALLKEAWVGGSLEHPNVIPVHALARAGASPAMVMKRVEGTGWDAVIADPEGHERFGGHDRLAWHLDVLMQVCHAVHYAHTRGILHLDLKPENVMIGEFGEVYVLDWGLAASFGDAAPDWLDAATEIAGVAGTPGYMAPELVAADGAEIDARTDVYLLGAVLHHIVTGGPLHRGETLMLQLSNAFSSRPQDYGEVVPAELAAIIHRATSREPADRFDGADVFRAAIEGFLLHRRADRAVVRAEATLEELDQTLSADTAPADLDVEPRFAECEVAIEQAAQAWQDHPAIGALMIRLLESRFGHAIRRRRPEAARAVLKRLEGEHPELEARLAALEEELAARRRRVADLEDMSRELDLTLGRQDRRLVFLGLGFLWMVFNVAFGWLTRTGVFVIGYQELLLEGIGLVATLVPFGYVRRAVLFQNLANRKLYGGLIFTAIAVELYWMAAYLLGVPVMRAVAITPLFYTYAFATLGIVLDRRLGWGALCLAIAAPFAGLFPDWAYDIVGIGGFLAVAATAWAWRRDELRAPT